MPESPAVTACISWARTDTGPSLVAARATRGSIFVR
jgi:hypothetical protein